jgi:hypothetical protein
LTPDDLPSRVRLDLDEAVSAVRVRSARRAEVSGVVVDAPDHGMISGPAALANAVAEHLYRGWYLRAGDAAPPRQGRVSAVDLDLVAALRASHAGTGEFVPGAVVAMASDQGRLEVRLAERRRVLDRCDYVTDPPSAGAASPGTSVLVARRFDWVDPSTRAWWSQPLAEPLRSGQRVRRWYWNARPDRVGRVVRVLTGWLARDDLPHAMKVQADPGALWRPDVIVVYVDAASAAALEPDLVATAAPIADDLDSPTPRLARVLSPGLAVADGAVGARSFGQVRCALIADALVGAALSGTDPLSAIVRRFELAGYDPARPELDPER